MAHLTFDKYYLSSKKLLFEINSLNLWLAMKSQVYTTEKLDERINLLITHLLQHCVVWRKLQLLRHNFSYLMMGSMFLMLLHTLRGYTETNLPTDQQYFRYNQLLQRDIELSKIK